MIKENIMRLSTSIYVIGLCSLAFICLVGCGRGNPITQNPTSTHIPLQTTPQNTNEINSTNSLTETVTHPPTVIYTPTPMVTLSYDEAVRKVHNLMQTNNNCQYPCWWGIVPGETEWLEANAFLYPFSTRIQREQDIYDPQLTIYFVDVPLPEETNGSFSIGFWVDQQGIVQQVQTGNKQPAETILENAGRPTEIYLGFTPALTPDLTNYHFSLVLYYKNGITVNFNGGNDSQGNSIILCKKDIINSSGSGLWLWPANKYSFEEIGQFGIIPPLVNNPYRSIDKINGTSSEQFYDMLLGNDQNNCVDFPDQYWK
jgi:hypothetical protein